MSIGSQEKKENKEKLGTFFANVKGDDPLYSTDGPTKLIHGAQ